MKYVYVANWKMYFTYHQAVQFCKDNYQALGDLVKNGDVEMVICPSYEAIAEIAETIKNSGIFIGAQNCSDYERGAYTGEISAASLKECGISYCIVGHSERRQYHGETDEIVGTKVDLLMRNMITPLFCVGETEADFVKGDTFVVLKRQLDSVFNAIKKDMHNSKIIIAYEPIWSIGTGVIPEQKYLEDVFVWLKDYCGDMNVTFLYGGSVDAHSVVQLKKIAMIEGFLIGKASTDIDQLLRIVKN